MAQDLLLMCGDTKVMRMNFDTGVFEVLCNKLLPFTLKGKIREPYPEKDSYTKYDLTQIQIIYRVNQQAIISWLANRVLSLSRTNAKWIYNLLKLEQLNNEIEKAKVALICRAVSVLDNYWIKLDGDKATWSEVNIRHVPLNEVIAQVALHGRSLTLQGSLNTPELTTHGAYAKAWRRMEDGKLWLLKKGNNGNTESRIEVMCSNLLDKMSVEHCHYEAGEDYNQYVCMCPCMSTDDMSIISGIDFVSYCNVHKLDPDKEMLRIDAEGIYKMWIVDYLIANRDRHGGNWGFYYDPNTMEILKCHPLYDHNNAFDVEWLQDREAPYQFGDMSIREAAKLAMSKVDFYFTDDFVPEDFITERQYKEFMWRAKDLGIVVRKSSSQLLNAIDKMK